mgnify:CR=1 FL=1
MDPKKVELSTYKSLVGYHLITAKNIDEYVMTTAENSVSILESAINEMEKRFQLFSDTVQCDFKKLLLWTFPSGLYQIFTEIQKY